MKQCKINHWSFYLASCSSAETYKAYRYITPMISGTVAQLYTEHEALTLDKEEKSSLLFLGTLVVTDLAKIS